MLLVAPGEPDFVSGSIKVCMTHEVFHLRWGAASRERPGEAILLRCVIVPSRSHL
jgi:hypothetical protein